MKFQLFIRGVDVDDPETGVKTRPRGSRGSGMTRKQFYQDLARKMVDDGRWQKKSVRRIVEKTHARLQKERTQREQRLIY